MDRKDFMKSLGGLCTGAGFLGCGCVRSLALDKGRDATEETPLADRLAFAQGYVKRLFDILDQELDPRARTHLVEAMGSACFQAWTKDEAPQPMTVDECVGFIEKHGGGTVMRREGNVLTYAFAMKPGVPITRCGCPIVGNGPEGLSGTFCQCSVGFVRAMFSGYLGRPVQVDLLEALQRGGKTCRFRITVG